ncbi:hypothetical protein HDV04_005630 [Boothiomyces sp. JEL0838]|nr:hypothetical protein HDV04_005630 [Boothiomyces sp. JEL0838]
MFKQLLLAAACFGYHAGKIEFVGKVKFVPPTDVDTLKSFGFFTDNWGIEYNLTAANTLDYVADPDGGINFAVTDDLEDDTCEVINHQPFNTKPLPSKGLSCQTAREDLSSKGLTLNGEPLVEKTTITALSTQ